MLNDIKRPEMGMSEVRPFLLRQIAELCELTSIPDENVPLIELGMDSVRFLSLIDALRGQGIILGLMDVIENPSLGVLERLIIERLSANT